MEFYCLFQASWPCDYFVEKTVTSDSQQSIVTQFRFPFPCLKLGSFIFGLTCQSLETAGNYFASQQTSASMHAFKFVSQVHVSYLFVLSQTYMYTERAKIHWQSELQSYTGMGYLTIQQENMDTFLTAQEGMRNEWKCFLCRQKNWGFWRNDSWYRPCCGDLRKGNGWGNPITVMFSSILMDYKAELTSFWTLWILPHGPSYHSTLLPHSLNHQLVSGVFSLLEPSQPWSQSNSSDLVELAVIVLEEVEFLHTCLVPDQ